MYQATITTATTPVYSRHQPLDDVILFWCVCLIGQSDVIDQSTITETERDAPALLDRLQTFVETKSAAGSALTCPVSCLRLEGDAGDDGTCDVCDII